MRRHRKTPRWDSVALGWPAWSSPWCCAIACWRSHRSSGSEAARGEHPCGAVPATPPCSLAQIREAATKVGLGADERASVTYGDRRDGDPLPLAGLAGKIDLTTGDGGVTFTFADPPSVPVAMRRWREVLVDKSGMHLKPVKGWLPLPTRFSADIMPPTCSFAGALKTIGAVTPGAIGTVRYGRGTGSSESGELDVMVPSAGLHNVIVDTECAASEKLSHK